MHSLWIWKNIYVPILLFCCVVSCKDKFTPKETFLKILDSSLTAKYHQMIIKVSWCLFPSVPVNKTSSYVKVDSRTLLDDSVFFKVDTHTKCKGGIPKSPRGLEASKKKYITKVNNTANNKVTVHNVVCHNGPHTYQQWLGEQFRFPWVAVQRCVGNCRRFNIYSTSKIIQREKIYNAGFKNITIYNEMCIKKSSGPTATPKKKPSGRRAAVPKKTFRGRATTLGVGDTGAKVLILSIFTIQKTVSILF